MATKNGTGIGTLKDKVDNEKNNKEKVPSSMNAQSRAEEQKKSERIKRKPGRPRTKDVKNTCKTVNVAVPITLLNQWEDIKIVHGSNLTGYITKLIEKDMDANYERYKQIVNSLNNI